MAAPRQKRRAGRMGGNMAPAEKARDFKGTVKKLLRYIGKFKIVIIIVMIFAIASTVFSIVGPTVLGNATTEIFNGLIAKFKGTGGINFDAIANILLTLAVLYIISAIFSFMQNILMSSVSQKIGYRLRKDISLKINLLPMQYFDHRQTGDVLSVITNDVDTLTTGLNQTANQFITSVTMIVGILVMMFRINVVMTVVSLLILSLSVVLLSVIIKRSQKYFVAQQEYLGILNGQIEEDFGGINIIQVFNHQKKSAATFDSANDTLYNSAWKSQFFSGLMMPVMQFIGNLAYVAAAVMGGYFAVNGTVTVGNIQSFITYVRQFTQPIQQIAQVTNMMQSMTAAAERIFNFLAEPEEAQKSEKHAQITENGVQRPVTANDVTGNVRFDRICFGYNPDKIIIHNFSADIKQGQKIAIVGPTGAGKTTIVKLLMRFYDLNSGAIYIDGNNITDFDRSELREFFGMVLQDTWLFNGTVMENIRYGKLEASDEEVVAAAKSAHVHNFVKTLPGGYGMVLNEEASNVSQGQKQLLTIARTILADPKILILDEATSSVDTRTEERIQKAMDNLMRGRTSFIIAHRLSTIRNADRILVMNNGDIIEQGTHDELIAANGFYCDLYNSQFEKSE